MEKNKNLNELYFSWLERVKKAEKSAHNILSKYEDSYESRVIHLKDLSKKLKDLPIDINSYFSEAICCLENDLRRSAVVMSWAGHFQVFAEKLYELYEQDIRKEMKKWVFEDISELKEKNSEFSILIVANKVGFINNAKLRVLQGQLSMRNQCAHPSLYKPTLNGAIGYVDEILNETVKILGV